VVHSGAWQGGRRAISAVSIDPHVPRNPLGRATKSAADIVTARTSIGRGQDDVFASSLSRAVRLVSLAVQPYQQRISAS
jgi:hypothetical protein